MSIFVVGEARDFSTGTFRNVFAPGGNGSEFRAELIIERRVWTGQYWALAESPEAAKAYRDFHSTVPA